MLETTSEALPEVQGVRFGQTQAFNTKFMGNT